MPVTSVEGSIAKHTDILGHLSTIGYAEMSEIIFVVTNIHFVSFITKLI